MCGAPRRAAVAAACTSSPLTSGSACGRHWSRWLATTSASASAGHQRARGLAVHALALGPVRSSSIAAATRPWARRSPSGPSSPAASQRVARRGQLADRDAGDGRHHVRERAVAEDRERRGHRPVAGRQRGQPPADDVAGDRRDRRRVVAGPVDRLGAVGGDLPAQLAQQPRVAADRAMALAAHRRRGLGRQAADELRRAARRQPLGVQDGRRPHAAEQAQQVRRRARVVDAGADGDQQRQVVDPPRQVGEHLERGAVGPLRVVDDQRERALLGERRAQPQHAVGDEHRRVPAGDGAVEQQRAGRRRGPVEQLRALAPRRPRAAAPPAARARPRRGSGARAGPAPRGARGSRRRRRSRGVLEQRRLAQARGRVEHDDPAVALGQAADRPVEHLDLDRALDQRRVVGGRRGLRCDDVEMGHRAATGGTDHVRCDAPRARNLPAVAQRPPERGDQ